MAPKKTRKKHTATKRTKKAPKGMRGQLGEWFEKLPTQNWFDFASGQRERLVKEVHGLAGEIVNRVGDATFFRNRDQLVKEVRNHMDSIISSLNRSELISKALGAASDTKNEILSFLNIPSQRELSTLQKRLNQLEKKMTRPRPRA